MKFLLLLSSAFYGYFPKKRMNSAYAISNLESFESAATEQNNAFTLKWNIFDVFKWNIQQMIGSMQLCIA